MGTEKYATRLAEMLSGAMNALSLIESAAQGNVIDGPLLRELLESLLQELTWLDEHRGLFQLEGLVWPADIADRVEQVRLELHVWDPSAPVPPGVLTSGAECLRFVRS